MIKEVKIIRKKMLIYTYIAIIYGALYFFVCRTSFTFGIIFFSLEGFPLTFLVMQVLLMNSFTFCV